MTTLAQSPKKREGSNLHGSRQGLALAALLLAALLPARAGATTIAEATWEELVDAADFLGIVECTVAGQLVARYRVIETWKGEPAPGAAVTLRQAAHNGAFGTQPVALVGERYLVTGYRGTSPVRILSSSGGGDSPVQWRELAADLFIPHFYGLVALPLDPTDDRPIHRLGSLRRDLGSFRFDVQRFLRLREEERRRLAEVDEGSRTAEPKPEAPAGAPPKLTPGQIRYLEKVLAAVPAGSGLDRYGDQEALQAFELLTEQQPQAAADWLVRWRREPGKAFANPGFLLASWFGWRCGSDCPRHLERLLAKAEEPAVRVAAAVYLGLHGREEDSAKALRTLSKLPGDSGAWAALTLARRGDRTAVPRALAGLGPQEGGDYLPSAQLYGQMLVLLSNTAAASGLPRLWAPVQNAGSALDVQSDEIHRRALAWWAKHGAKAKLADPWRQELAAQRID